MMDIEEEKIYVSEAMIKYGGSFVRSLGEALINADAKNTKKIKEGWSDYWKEYLEQGKKEVI